jgi:hypothetical protein
VLPDLRGVAAETEHGVLQRGDALMLYTDGLVEAPGRDIDAGTDRLLGEAERILSAGFSGSGPGRLVGNLQVAGDGSDDCALVLIWRSLRPAPGPDHPLASAAARASSARPWAMSA